MSANIFQIVNHQLGSVDQAVFGSAGPFRCSTPPCLSLCLILDYQDAIDADCYNNLDEGSTPSSSRDE